MIESSQLLEVIVKAADDKRAEDIIVLDVDGISLLADYFLICHGNSEKQVGAIVDEIADVARQNGVHAGRIEGKESGKWVLVDLGDIVVHVFHASERDFYNLEKLWSDAPMVNISSMVE